MLTHDETLDLEVWWAEASWHKRQWVVDEMLVTMSEWTGMQLGPLDVKEDLVPQVWREHVWAYVDDWAYHRAQNGPGVDCDSPCLD